MNCPWCARPQLQSVYNTPSIPVFQNKVYASQLEARQAITGSVKLFACNACGYVFNGNFDVSLMHYDHSYQNEQALSPTFDNYLDELIQLFEERGFRGKNVVEIGCGKGTFLEKLWDRGFTALGFDTAYEGSDPRVCKQYFGEQHKHLPIDLIILRHTLEHIVDPLSFLRNLANLTQPNTKIYIEVPALEWIIGRNAFWDVFYEHCNYFTMQSLTAIFGRVESGLLFGEQYMYVLADLQSLRVAALATGSTTPASLASLQIEIDDYKQFVKQHKGLLVWGAGAKGSTFVNLTDPLEQHISSLIDINPKKAGRYVALTGHAIISPDLIGETGAHEIMVMNENYLDEIKELLANMGLINFKFFTLGLL